LNLICEAFAQRVYTILASLSALVDIIQDYVVIVGYVDVIIDRVFDEIGAVIGISITILVSQYKSKRMAAKIIQHITAIL